MAFRLNQIKIKYKLWTIIGLMVTGTAFLVAVSLWSLTHNLLADRKQQTRHEVETAYSLVEHYYQRVQSGVLSDAEGQREALEALKSLRYGAQQYFWVNDMHAVMVMHPIKPALNGKDLSNFADPTGKKLFTEFVEIVQRQDEGFIDYLWPKPGAQNDDPVKKIAYVKGFKPWGWIIGNGIYLDDMTSIFWEALRAYALTVVILTIVVGGSALLIIHAITQRLTRFQNIMLEVRASGDLSHRVAVDSQDELGQMAAAFNHMLDRFQEVVEHAGNSAESLTHTIEELNHIASSTRQGAENQEQETEQTATAMQQMAATALDSASSAENASEQVNRVREQAQNGLDMINHNNERVHELARQLEQAGSVIQALDNSTNEIGTILEVIEGIAEQTNLLALNAAIEAARAGDAGRGFAVVADEVRSLASRSHDSTQQIQTMIRNLQSSARDAVNVMSSSRDLAEETVEGATRAGQAFAEITTSIGDLESQNAAIASAVEEQSQVAEEISASLTRITDVADQTRNDIQQLVDAGQQLSDNAEQLRARIRQFHT